jgi:hypothetical protein
MMSIAVREFHVLWDDITAAMVMLIKEACYRLYICMLLTRIFLLNNST